MANSPFHSKIFSSTQLSYIDDLVKKGKQHSSSPVYTVTYRCMKKDSDCSRTRPEDEQASSEEFGTAKADDSVSGVTQENDGCKRAKKGETFVFRTVHWITEVDDLVLGNILRECFSEFPVAVKLVCRRWKKLTICRKANKPESSRGYSTRGELITTLHNSARIGSVAVLEWMNIMYGNIPSSTCLPAHQRIFKDYIRLYDAVKGGHLLVLQWIRCRYPSVCMESNFVKLAIQHNQKDILRWLLQANGMNPYNITKSYMHHEAIKYGRLDMLELLGPIHATAKEKREIGISYCECGHLSDEGLFDLMKWVSDNIRPWCKAEASAAVNLEKPLTLRLLTEAGCPCSGEVMMKKALRASSSDIIDAVDELIVKGVTECNLSPSVLYRNALHSEYDTGVRWLHRKGISTKEILQHMSVNGTLQVNHWLYRYDVIIYMVKHVFKDQHLKLIAESPCIGFNSETDLEFFERFEKFMRKKNGRDEPVFHVERMVREVLKCGNKAVLRWIVQMRYVSKDFVPSAEHYRDAAQLCNVPSLKFMNKYSDRNAEWSEIVKLALAEKTHAAPNTEQFTLLLDYLFNTKRLTLTKKTIIDSIENSCYNVFEWLISFPWFIKTLDRETVEKTVQLAAHLRDHNFLDDTSLDSLKKEIGELKFHT